MVALCAAGIGLIWFLVSDRSAARRPNVILISIDTCRADRLGTYGHAGNTSPNVDALAREAIVVENAVSTVPLTLPAHCSMLTGVIPPSHGVRDNINYRLHESHTTLAERLRAYGYQSTAIIGAFVLDSQTGIDQGFDSFDDRLVAGAASAGDRPERRAEEVSQLAIRWLAGAPQEPFFLFLHYYDPHDPYDPPEPFASQFRDDLYAGEIAYTDAAIGHVLEKLRALGLYQSSLIVITSDHGESLGEHGESTHGYFVYRSTTRVPLIIRPPGGMLGRRIERKASLIDVVPTILSQCGLPLPDELQGRDLFSDTTGMTSDILSRYAYSESLLATKYDCAPLFSLENDTWRYIHTSVPELYRLADDPDELVNVIDQHPDPARSMRNRLVSLLAGEYTRKNAESELEMDAQSLARLQALGYAGGAVDDSFELESDREAPGNFIQIHSKLERMDHSTRAKDYAESQAIGREILRDRPNLVHVHRRLGLIAIEQMDFDAAMFHYSEALRIDPNARDAPVWHNNLGLIVARQGDDDKAVEHFQAAIRMVDGEVLSVAGDGTAEKRRRGAAGLVLSTRMNMGDLRLRQGRFEDAAREYRAAVAVAPENPGPHFQLGIALSKLGQSKEAAESQREAARIQQQNAARSPDRSPHDNP